MASVCGGSLAMMQAGVPLRGGNVAGIAMGMLLPAEDEGGGPVIISDILGVEDALGTMDFKTAGTREGISTFQLDIKCEGLSLEVMRKALDQAREGRLKILDAMDAVMATPSAELHHTIPQMVTISVPKDAVRKVIGKGGATINALTEDHELENIQINDEGEVQLVGYSTANIEKAKAAILAMTGSGDRPAGMDRDPTIPLPNMTVPEAGTILRGCKTIKVAPFGCFMEVDAESGLHGLILTKDLDPGWFTKIESTFKVNDILDVKVVGISDKNGRLLLSRKAIVEEEGEEKHKLPDDGREQPEQRRGRGAPRQRAPDASIPPTDAKIPDAGTVLRDLKVVSVKNFGLFVAVDEKLQALILLRDLDSGYVASINDSFKEGDVLDAKVVGISKESGRLMLSRKTLMEEEGSERHELPDDGRPKPRQGPPPPRRPR
eukprot:gnl/MRDRNA2_/MRDRNA2_120545_c0_seq1.p1 gnl/MRDRNA2_/MRDRNA2_120545_c0~~gnl/MRDRNA2_/MRDRNA2_120545_c0_seq1.p1  ORF type:complete len:434 (-),score=104.98 gnl/MRDRNA2_/MRDRNA2_120545_c0_seq1:158-1459(-)